MSYWLKRYESLMSKQMLKADKLSDESIHNLTIAMQDIERDIGRWALRYGKANGISFNEANKELNNMERQLFLDDLNAYKDKVLLYQLSEGTLSGIYQQIESMSAKIHYTRLQSLYIQIANHIALAYAKNHDELAQFIRDNYKDTYYKSLYEYEKVKKELKHFGTIPTEKLDMILANPWTPDGKNFSERLWGDREKLILNLQQVMTQNLIKGSNPQKMIKVISDRMNVAKSQAKRLILTESAYFNNLAIANSFERLGLDEYEYIATLDSRTSEVCRNLDLKVFKLSDKKIGVNYPPMHCHCRSVTAPHIKDLKDFRIARDERGNNTYVPSDISYKEWYNKYIDHDTVEPVEVNNGKWQKIKYHKSYARSESIDVLKKYQIEYTEGKRKKADEVILSNMAEFVETFYNKYTNVLKNNPHPLKNIDMMLSSKMPTHIAGRFRYYTDSNIPVNLELNLHYHDDLQFITTKIKKTVDRGWHSKATDPTRTFVHEWGHYISNCFVNIKKDKSWEDKFIKKVINAYNSKYNANVKSCLWCKDLVSQYGATKNCELFAECFAEYFDGEPREFATVFGELLEEELNKL